MSARGHHRGRHQPCRHHRENERLLLDGAFPDSLLQEEGICLETFGGGGIFIHPVQGVFADGCVPFPEDAGRPDEHDPAVHLRAFLRVPPGDYRSPSAGVPHDAGYSCPGVDGGLFRKCLWLRRRDVQRGRAYHTEPAYAGILGGGFRPVGDLFERGRGE